MEQPTLPLTRYMLDEFMTALFKHTCKTKDPEADIKLFLEFHNDFADNWFKYELKKARMYNKLLDYREKHKG